MSSHWLLITHFDHCVASICLFDDLDIAKSTFKNLVKETMNDYNDHEALSNFDKEFEKDVTEVIKNGNLLLYKYGMDYGSHTPDFVLIPFDITKLNEEQYS